MAIWYLKLLSKVKTLQGRRLWRTTQIRYPAVSVRRCCWNPPRRGDTIPGIACVEQLSLEKCALNYYPRVSVRSVRVCVYAGGNGAAQHTKYLSLTIVSISRYWLFHEACSLPWNGDCLFSRSFFGRISYHKMIWKVTSAFQPIDNKFWVCTKVPAVWIWWHWRWWFVAPLSPKLQTAPVGV